MTTIPTPELAQKVADCRTATDTKAKGEALEELVSWVFGQIPGLRCVARNTFSEDGSQEIDISFWNDRVAGGLPSLADSLPVECKNWTGPVGAAEVAWFVWKLARGGAVEGVFIAAEGVTGNSERRSHAWAVLQWAKQLGFRIVMLSLDDLEKLQTSEQLVKLIQDRLVALTTQIDPFSLPFPLP